MSTREPLLEAAGQVFVEMGFDRATGKEICREQFRHWAEQGSGLLASDDRV